MGDGHDVGDDDVCSVILKLRGQTDSWFLLAEYLELVGRCKPGDTPTASKLRSQGRRWSQHVLEGPLSWILGTLYIFLTVCLGVTPICAIVSAAIGRSLPAPELDASVGPSAVLSADVPSWLWAARHLAIIADSTLYAFLPWWVTVLFRLVQGRPWLHRVAGRSILIGDVPWVAQSAEAFASKLFALSYSIASCSFASANPADHLVHRHMHCVRRGSLLAVGRPDGRLNALSTAEAACTLAVDQASSIPYPPRSPPSRLRVRRGSPSAFPSLRRRTKCSRRRRNYLPRAPDLPGSPRDLPWAPGLRCPRLRHRPLRRWPRPTAATALVAEATAVARAPAAIAAGEGIASANASAGRPCRGAEAAAEAPTHAAEAVRRMARMMLRMPSRRGSGPLRTV